MPTVVAAATAAAATATTFPARSVVAARRHVVAAVALHRTVAGGGSRFQILAHAGAPFVVVPRPFWRASQSFMNRSSPRSVSGCFTSFVKTS